MIDPHTIDVKASAKRTLCQRSFYYFVKTFWDTIITEEPVWNWHIEYLCEELQKIAFNVKERKSKEFDYFIINVPPGSSKSTICSIMYPAWVWSMDSTQRFICGSYADRIALDMADKCRTIIQSDKYKKYFPDVYIKQETEAKSHFKNNTGGERYATSTGAAITGVHGHQIIIDDPMNPKKAASELERKTANKWISETLSTRQVDKKSTAFIIIMQRLHENDCTGYLKSRKGLNVKHICLPAEQGDNISPPELSERYIDGLLDPVRMSRQILETIKIDLGSYGYAGQFGQRPSPEEGGILKKHWFAIVDKPIPKDAVIHFRLDTAYTEDQLNDPTGILPYFKEEGFIYITDWTSQFLEFPELIKFIKTYVVNHGYSYESRIKIEPKASGKSVVQQLRHESALNVSEDRPPKDDKVTRANGISARCEAGRVKLIRGSWNDNFLNEIGAFPNGLHDEAIDCLVATVEDELIDNREGWGIKRAN